MKSTPLLSFIQHSMQKLSLPKTVGQSAMLLVLRLLYGGQFLQTGYGKLTHLDRTTEYFSTLHIPAPGFQAPLVGCTEFVGGILLVLGLGTRLASVPLTVSMIVAYLTAERAEAFKSLDSFTAATPFQFLLACLLLLAFGPGKVALDSAIAGWFKNRLAPWGERCETRPRE